MTIQFAFVENTFHLTNGKVSLIMGLLKTRHLAHHYFGPSLPLDTPADHFRNDQNAGLTAYVDEGCFDVSLGVERLACPVYGGGDFRLDMVHVRQAQGEPMLDLRYHSHRFFDGKPTPEGLPCVRPQVESMKTLAIVLKDASVDLLIELNFTLIKDKSALVTSVCLENQGQPIDILNLKSGCLDLPDSEWQVGHLHGDWISERQYAHHSLQPGVFTLSSGRGASSAHHSPFMLLKRPEATENQGHVLGGSLIYSGNFEMSVEVDSRGQTRWVAGLNQKGFTWGLNQGQKFYTPEMLYVYSSQGLNGMSQTLHDITRQHLVHDRWQGYEKPVLINNWEATYFDFDEDKLLSLASKAAQVGIELFVLDDGWFGERNSDTIGLGDWTVNQAKLPGGLKGLAKALKNKGLAFGLWFEPEMVNKGSKLFKAHPDWVLGHPQRHRSQARNQYVLDFANPQVVDAIWHQLTALLEGLDISYIKWDMNRNITEPYSQYLKPNQQGELHHRYMLGVYDLYTRMTTTYPHILIESCAAGGGRFDLGMVYYAPQAWASDNTDAVSRLAIQAGASLAFPLSAMGSHVSACPNHQVKRQTPLKMRADVAYFGTFGYELDLTNLSEQDLRQVTDQVAFFKSHRTLIHQGDFYRLMSPWDSKAGKTAWMVVSKDKSEALVAWYQPFVTANPPLEWLRLVGLKEGVTYQVNGDQTVTSQVLCQVGLKIVPSFNGITQTHEMSGDYQSRVWHLKRHK